MLTFYTTVFAALFVLSLAYVLLYSNAYYRKFKNAMYLTRNAVGVRAAVYYDLFSHGD